ncbi:VCBS repeat-containing protein [Streptomyces sp. 130]|uniref:FG-GAP-like repeat-containing protein n=1 Tax=Streptomyces sp. 130 TaxID=2591006 RepID=UPI00117F75DA|nr:FG-GAP-like repeat-containing protein [Streptomyces sp. 130]TRV73113.1 VCBS repeat-containing protein [Streptomyces sp. 130]
MRAHTSRRALRLASGLVAAGLALTAAPHALAADSGDGTHGMRLTSAQAKKLTDRLQVDLYGDDAVGIDTSDPAKVTGTTGGSHPDAAAKSAAPQDATTEAAANVTMTSTSSVEGVKGFGATMPADSKNGDYFTLHSLGHVARSTADGTEQWSRTATSLYADWGVKPLRAWDRELYPPLVQMGYNAVSPFTPASDQGYGTGDLSGDGVPDVVFSASVGENPPSGVTIPGTKMTSGTIVTILDGRTGNTLWSKFYSYATMVQVVDGTLLVGNAPRMNGSASTSETAQLTGTRFSYADGKLTESSTWTYDTDEVQPATWGALQDLGNGKVAVSWDLRKTEITTARGRTLVLDVNDGSVVWQQDSALYSRQLRMDAGRNQLVAVEQTDPNDEIRYEIVAYDLGDGRRTTLDSRVNVLPTAFTVGDLTGNKKAEYAVSESSLTDSLFVSASTIRVLDGADPETALWQHTTKRGADNPQNGPSTWRLDVVNKKLVAAAQDDSGIGTAANVSGRYASLTVFSGKGKVRWQTKGATASPTFQDVFKDKSGRHIRVVDGDQNVRTYDFKDGAEQRLTPLQADMAYAQSVDVDGDKKADFVGGGNAHGVWAYSGTSLLNGKPKKLWQAALPGSVHRIETADVTGDKQPEIVVAADSAVVVLDSRTGDVLTTIDGGGQYVRSVVLSDVNGDKKADILVPTDALRAYKGNGRALWTYSAPESAGDVSFSDPSTGDGQVYVQYTSADSIELDAPVMRAVRLDAKTGAEGWSIEPKAPASAQDGKLRGGILDHAVYASPEIPYADGHAVVYTWIAWAPLGANGSDALLPYNVMEIRDGRTGEMLHRTYMGGLWTHGNYFDGDGTLMQAGAATVRSFLPGGEDHTLFLTPDSRSGGWLTAPGGQRVVVTGVQGGVYLWDPSLLDGEMPYPDALGRTAGTGSFSARNYLAADFDGDGVDEVVTLNFDERGADQSAELVGGRYLIQSDGTPKMATYKLS